MHETRDYKYLTVQKYRNHTISHTTVTVSVAEMALQIQPLNNSLNRFPAQLAVRLLMDLAVDLVAAVQQIAVAERPVASDKEHIALHPDADPLRAQKLAQQIFFSFNLWNRVLDAFHIGVAALTGFGLFPVLVVVPAADLAAVVFDL